MRADVITGVSAFVMLVVGADISANAETVVVTIAVIGFKFTVREVYAVEISVNAGIGFECIVSVACEGKVFVRTGATIGGAPGADAEVNASRLEDVLTSLGFKTNEEIFLSC